MLTISIIIPVYKVEAYIEECLASVVSQQDAGIAVECIIVDDCSPDGSMDIVRRFVDNYQGAVQFRLLRHEVNRGLSAARNTGIDAATGDYLLFVDSDDYLSADCLSTLMSGFNLCPEADVVQANNLSGIGGGESLWYHTSRPYVLTGGQACVEAILFDRIPIMAWNKLVNRQFVLSHQLYFIEGIIHEDNPWTYQLLSEVSTVVVLPQVTYYYRYVTTSITQDKVANLVKRLHSFQIIIDHVMNLKQVRPTGMLLYVFPALLRDKHLISQVACPEGAKQAMRDVEKQLFATAKTLKRPIMLLFFLTICRPMSHIYRIRFVRSHFQNIKKVVGKFELMIDRLVYKS